MKKNKKILLTVIFATVAAGIIIAVLLIANHVRKNQEDQNEVKEFASITEAMEYTGFRMTHSDRLLGWPVSGFTADKTTITVLFNNAGFIRKSLLPDPDEEPSEETVSPGLEASEHVIDGMTVYFHGNGGNILSAHWIDNGYDYLISFSENSGTATEEEMTDYVRMTR